MYYVTIFCCPCFHTRIDFSYNYLLWLNKNLSCYFLRAPCVGLSGGESLGASCLSDRLGTFLRLVESFLSGRGDMLVDSTFWDTSELLNQTPFAESDTARKRMICSCYTFRTFFNFIKRCILDMAIPPPALIIRCYYP